MNERIIIDALKNIGLQLRNMQAKIIDLDSDIKSLGQSRGVTG